MPEPDWFDAVVDDFKRECENKMPQSTKPDAALAVALEKAIQRSRRDHSRPITPSGITPLGFAKEMIEAARGDPGTEYKCMLFIDVRTKRFMKFVRFRSDARVMVLELEGTDDPSA